MVLFSCRGVLLALLLSLLLLTVGRSGPPPPFTFPAGPSLTMDCADGDADCVFDSFNAHHNEDLTSTRYQFMSQRNLLYCRSPECVRRFALQHDCRREVIYLFLITNIRESFAVSYFIPWVQHFLTIDSHLEQYFLLADLGEQGSDKDRFEFFMSFYHVLPRCTVFCVFHCNSGHLTFDIRQVWHERRRAGLPAVMIHLSNENPYPQMGNSSDDVASFCYGDPIRYGDYYKQYDLVLRNYFYRPLDSLSVYVPLGSREFDLLRYFASPARPASQRHRFRCFFSGRFSYDHWRPHHYERRELLEILEHYSKAGSITVTHEGRGQKEHAAFENNPMCTVYQSSNEIITTPTLSYIRHIFFLQGAQFCLTPAGNSPETFRLYEALETGCIPILVYPLADMDYIREKWEVRSPEGGPWGYPGPVLYSWKDLPGFWEAIDGLKPSVDGSTLSQNLTFLQRYIFSDSVAASIYTTDCHAENQELPLLGPYPKWTTLLAAQTVARRCGPSSTNLYDEFVDLLQLSSREWYFQFLREQSRIVAERIGEVIYGSRD